MSNNVYQYQNTLDSVVSRMRLNPRLKGWDLQVIHNHEDREKIGTPASQVTARIYGFALGNQLHDTVHNRFVYHRLSAIVEQEGLSEQYDVAVEITLSTANGSLNETIYRKAIQANDSTFSPSEFGQAIDTLLKIFQDPESVEAVQALYRKADAHLARSSI